MAFVVLPDHPATAGIVEQLSDRVIAHPSGRPWIVGQWRDDELTLTCAGANRLALLGCTTADPIALRRRLRDVRTVAGLDQLVASLHGCFHLAGSIDREVRVQGSLSTARQIFYGNVAGVTVAADRPQTLARLAGTAPDEELLVLRLLAPYGAPWPLNDQCLWKGVQALGFGHYLRLDRTGLAAREIPWWTPPGPDRPLEPGTAIVRHALSAAVAARCQGVDVVGADLSGGIDSTSLCYLAAEPAARLVTIHYAPLAPANSDHLWAERCAADLPNASHVVVPGDTEDEWYAEQAKAEPDGEAPYPFDRSRPTVAHQARLAAEHGVTRQLQGIGSDELFHPSHRCRTALRVQPYHQWLARCAERLSVAWEWSDPIDWEVEPKLPPWATPDAFDSAHRLLAEAAAAGPRPISPLPVQHEMVRLAQHAGAVVRRTSRIAERFGVSLEAPYLDDRVLEAAMSVRIEDRVVEGQSKPLLHAALRDRVPVALLDREHKEASTHEGYAARRRISEMAELCEDSRLERLGLIRTDALRSALTVRFDPSRPAMPLEPTRSCELWLRSVEPRSPVEA
jgi:asparagine synthase (glutamine-hydrolysing)